MTTRTASLQQQTQKKRRKLKRFSLVDCLIYIFVGLFAFTTLYPFVNLLFQSVSPNWVITEANGMLLWPKEVTLENYRYVFLYPNVWNSYKNTIFVTVVGTSISLIMTTLGGYALSKRDLPGRFAMTMYILITMYVSGGLIPTYLNLRSLGLLNTLWVMIIPDMISTGNLLLMRNFFLGMPEELKESAYLDGASESTTLIRVVLPLSMPIIATIALFYGVSNWEEYTTPLLYCNDVKYYPIQVILQRMYTQSVQQVTEMDDINSAASKIATEAVKAATVIFATVPILFVYPFAQKHFAKGVMVGSLKG